MKTFIALLALVSGLLLLEQPARADDTAKFCVNPKSEAEELIDKMKADYGYKTIKLDGPAAQAYLQVLREFTEVPDLPGITLIIIYNEGAGAFLIAIKGENRCGHTAVSWPVHKRAILAADRTNV